MLPSFRTTGSGLGWTNLLARLIQESAPASQGSKSGIPERWLCLQSDWEGGGESRSLTGWPSFGVFLNTVGGRYQCTRAIPDLL